MIRAKEIFLTIYNQNVSMIGQIHDIISMKWITCFKGIGSFECTCSVDDLELLELGNIVARNDLRDTYIIEQVTISRTIEGTKIYHIFGRSTVSILDWRVVMQPTTYKNITKKAVIQELANEHFYRASSERQIQIFNYKSLIPEDGSEESQDGAVWQIPRGSVYEGIKGLLADDEALRTQLVTDTVYKESTDLSISLKLITKEDHHEDIFFTEDLENIAAWSFDRDKTAFRNVAFVAGEGEGLARHTIMVGAASGFERREVYVDARDLTRDTEDGLLSVSEYEMVLRQRGIEQLDELKYIFKTATEVTTELYPDMSAEWIGWIVTIDTGVYKTIAYIEEITEIFDATGYSIFPTFNIEYVHFNLTTESAIDIITENGYELITENEEEK